MQFPLSSRVLFFLYKSECVVLKIEVPPLSGPRRYVHFGVCEAQSASFALATTRPPDGLLNASRPTTQLRTILYKFIRRSRGRQDAIDFVAIASSLQATNGRQALDNTNRLKAVPLRLRGARNRMPRNLVLRTQGSHTTKTSKLMQELQR